MPIGRILGRPCPPGHTEETAMYHTIGYRLARAGLKLRRRQPRPAPHSDEGTGGYVYAPGGHVLAGWAGGKR
jgi:hypothetical protein